MGDTRKAFRHAKRDVTNACQMAMLVLEHTQALIPAFVQMGELRKMAFSFRLAPGALGLLLTRHQYCTFQNTRPAAGAFSPAAVRSQASSTSRHPFGLAQSRGPP